MKKNRTIRHSVDCLDYANVKSRFVAYTGAFILGEQLPSDLLLSDVAEADIVLVHYWDHPMLKELLSEPLPPCRLVAWCHHNSPYTDQELSFPDLWLDTSPVQGHERHIWSTGDISRFLEIKPKKHEGFNIGYVGTVDWKKMHPEWLPMCIRIKQVIPEARFTVVGENKTGIKDGPYMTFTGKVDDVAPYLAEMDVFGYPLRADHYGTCEQVLGEAMAAGVVPVVMDNPCERLIWTGGCRSTEEYVKEVCLLGRGPGERYLLSSVARERAKKIYSIDNMISQWNAVFEEMMSKPKRERTPL